MCFKNTIFSQHVQCWMPILIHHSLLIKTDFYGERDNFQKDFIFTPLQYRQQAWSSGHISPANHIVKVQVVFMFWSAIFSLQFWRLYWLYWSCVVCTSMYNYVEFLLIRKRPYRKFENDWVQVQSVWQSMTKEFARRPRKTRIELKESGM
jgi:hypothetical protein